MQSNHPHYDVAVLGIGAMGAAAAYYLAKSGCRVLGLEQFDIPNDRGSHSGHTRIIRKAYFEHPAYVPLLERAYVNWKELEDQIEKPLYRKTGLLYAAPQGHALMQGVRFAAKTFSIPVETWDHAMVSNAFPIFRIPESYDILFEPDAGYLLATASIEGYAAMARKLGATIMTQMQVTACRQNNSGYEIHTTGDVYTADKIVITTGAWTQSFLPDLAPKLEVTRQTLGWFTAPNPDMYQEGAMPCWMFAEADTPGVYYGFPEMLQGQVNGPAGLKIAHHTPGKRTLPDQLDRKISADDIAAWQKILRQYFNGSELRFNEGLTCMYTNTPDEHFIVDTIPGHDQRAVVAAGFSGHGFKFASVMGEVIAELIVYGNTPWDIELFKWDRW